jgi:hypothetical protein
VFQEDLHFSNDGDFDYNDQYDPSSSFFRGSTKGFGRASSFFPQVFNAHASDTESRVSNLTTESKSVKRREDAQKALGDDQWMDSIPPPAGSKGANKPVANPAVLESIPPPRQPLSGPPPLPPAATGPPPPPSYEESAKHPAVPPHRAWGMDSHENSSVSSTGAEQGTPAQPRGQPTSHASPVVIAQRRGSKDLPALSPPAPRAPPAADHRHNDMMYRPPDSPEPSPTKGGPRTPQPILRMSSCDALQIGLLLSQQEAEFGTNMYDSLEDSDEPSIRRLVAQGYSNDEAVLEIFNMKFGKTGPRTKWSNVSAAAPVVSRLPPAPMPARAPPPGPAPNPYSYPYGPPVPPPQPMAPAPYQYDQYDYPSPPPPMSMGYSQTYPQPPAQAMRQSMYSMPVPAPIAMPPQPHMMHAPYDMRPPPHNVGLLAFFYAHVATLDVTILALLLT